jgi:pyruvate dehydrogenase E2 component (dihydrolipoamide acetyltransferase)
MTGKPLTGWRKIASAVWGPPSDPQIYGFFEVDATKLAAFMRDARELGHHVTPTHLAGRALAQALLAVPSLNVRLVGGRAIPRESIDVFFITSLARGTDLSGTKLANVDQMSAIEVARELDERSRRLRAGDDPALARAKRAMEVLPRPLLRLALRFSSWLAGTLARDIPWLGVSRSPFGSAMVSSVGMLGVPSGFTPLSFLYKVPAIVLLGEITEKPVAVAGAVEIHPVLPVTATIDHRYADGAELGVALKTFRAYLEDPTAFEPPLDATGNVAGVVRSLDRARAQGVRPTSDARS